MNNHLLFVEKSGQVIGFEEVQLNEFQAFGGSGQLRPMGLPGGVFRSGAGNTYLMADGQELLGDVAVDEPGSADDGNFRRK